MKFNSFSYDVTDTTLRNDFTATPLTAENLQRVIADMTAKAGQPLGVQPNTFIVPHAVYEQWLQLRLHDAEAELKHATKLSTRAILSGRYGKRRRQIVDGVDAARLQRRREAIVQLPQLHDDVVRARAALLDFKKPFHYVEVTTPMTTTLPTLYKRNSNATAIQQWTISVTDATITTVYGQVGGAMQTTSDTVTQGKNLSKKNATTPEQQAMLEAEAQHEKKRKSGYVASLEQAQKGGLDELIEGGVVPMLAKVYSDRADKVVFPVAVQPKLDGHRCVAVIVVDETVLGRRATVTLWTRTRKRIKSLPHIEKQLSEIFCKWEIGTYHLDGENYQHDYRDRFEELTSLIRPDEPRPGHEIVEYHIYDIVSPETFLNRFKTLEHVFDTTTHLKLVETHVAADEAALLSHYDYFKKQGYEGAMCRTLDTPYEHKRSSSLLKMKDFVDGEFRVVRLEEGRGKLQRHVGAFVCVTEDGVEFGAKGAMPNETLRQAWLEPEKWVGKMMTVKYFGKTADGSLRFPSALRLHEVAS